MGNPAPALRFKKGVINERFSQTSIGLSSPTLSNRDRTCFRALFNLCRSKGAVKKIKRINTMIELENPSDDREENPADFAPEPVTRNPCSRIGDQD